MIVEVVYENVAQTKTVIVNANLRDAIVMLTEKLPDGHRLAFYARKIVVRDEKYNEICKAYRRTIGRWAKEWIQFVVVNNGKRERTEFEPHQIEKMEKFLLTIS